MKKDKPLFDLENEYEVYMIKEVLTDQGIPFRITYSDRTYWGILLGSGASIMSVPYAKLWGYAEDKGKISLILNEIRTAKPLDDINELARPKVWRIKKT